MLDFLKNEQIVNTCVIILLVAILFMTFINFNQINSQVHTQQENYCGCDKPTQVFQQIETQQSPTTKNNSDNSENSNKNKLILYYAMWCGYSRQFLPVWEQIKTVVENTPDLNTICLQHDCDAEKQMCENVKGFPTVILIKPDGTKIHYQEARTVESVLSFVNKNK